MTHTEDKTKEEEAEVREPARPSVPVGVNDHGFEIRTLDEAWRWGIAIARGGFFPVLNTPERVITVKQLAHDNGVSFSLIAMNIAFINGRACMCGDALIGIAHASRNMEDFEETMEGEGDELTAVCRIKRRGIPTPIIRRFGVEDARAAELLGKDNYRHYLRRMLRMRARSWGLRDAGLVQGIIAREEAEDIQEADIIAPTPIPAPQSKSQALGDRLTGERAPDSMRDEPPVVEAEDESQDFTLTGESERKIGKDERAQLLKLAEEANVDGDGLAKLIEEVGAGKTTVGKLGADAFEKVWARLLEIKEAIGG